MAGVTMMIDDSELQRDLKGVRDRLGNAQPAFEVIGEMARTSIVRNFEEEGRPEKWAPLSPATLARRSKAGQILRVQGFAGGLMGSINAQAAPDNALIGTNKIYGAVQHFGAKKGAFGRTSKGAPIPWGDIPARPYMVLQEEDETRAVRILGNFVLRGSLASDGS
jgi:phage virion morphogenesis protein